MSSRRATAVQSSSMPPHHPTTEPAWTTRRLIEAAAQHLTRKGVDAPKLSAELLLAHVLETPRIGLYADLDRPASELERAAYRTWIERAAGHEPVQYLLGEAHFFSMVFEVTPATLIPRSSTETLVEHVIRHARLTPGFSAPVIADIGTGSGCIAVTLAKQIPSAKIIATDISPDALEVASRNAEKHKVADRIEFRQGSLFEPFGPERFHFIVSNPPYISDAEWLDVRPNVRDHEPVSAPRGGQDGLSIIRSLVAEAHAFLLNPAQLVIEIAASQDKLALELAGKNAAWRHVHVLADHERLPRVLVADHAGS